jgi:hypothetical protein
VFSPSCSCLTYAAYVPTGPPPDRGEFIARCRASQRELLWARHDKRTRRWAAETVEQVWRTMDYMAGRRNVPTVGTRPEQLLRLRPDQAAGAALEALAVAIAWAQSQPDVIKRPECE